MDILGLGLITINDWLLLFTFLGALLYWYGTSTFDIFEKAGIKGPKPYPIAGNLLSINKLGFSKVDMEIIPKYGSLVGTFQGRTPTLIISDPDHIKQVCVKDIHIFTNRFSFDSGIPLFQISVNALKGDDWKRVRSILTPTFSTGKMRKMMHMVNKSIDVFIKHFGDIADKKKSFEGKEEYGKLTVAIIASTMFGIEVDAINDPDCKFPQYIKQAFSADGFKAKLFVMIALYFPFTAKYLRYVGLTFTPEYVIDYFVKSTNQVLEERRKEGAEKYNDFMALMLKAHTDDDVDKEDLETQKQLENGTETRTKKGLSDEEILAQALIFYFAGYETTATLMSFMSYCLATNPHCQDTLYQEIVDNTGDEDLTYDALQKLQYLDQVMWETLRLHPPVLRFDRVASAPFEIGGHQLPEGVDVHVSVYYLHHCEKYWPDAYKFIPERFSPEEKAKRNPYVYCPFGHGPRNCIGMRFAIMEAKAAICQVVKNFRIELAPGMETNLDPLDPNQKWKTLGFHYPESGIHLQVTKR